MKVLLSSHECGNISVREELGRQALIKSITAKPRGGGVVGIDSSFFATPQKQHHPVPLPAFISSTASFATPQQCHQKDLRSTSSLRKQPPPPPSFNASYACYSDARNPSAKHRQQQSSSSSSAFKASGDYHRPQAVYI